jgi:hypothetical protein
LEGLALHILAHDCHAHSVRRHLWRAQANKSQLLFLGRTLVLVLDVVCIAWRLWHL